MKRAFDIFVAGAGAVLSAPLVAIATLGVYVSDPGPVFFRHPRAGRANKPFWLFKIRTMRQDAPSNNASITSARDNRVFAWGRVIRALKMDELPQFLNILRGEMSVVGPRPEALDIVHQYYSPLERETLSVRPGLTSPGTLYYYTHGEQMLDGSNDEELYVEQLMPIKATLDLLYIRRANLRSDLAVILQTVLVIAAKALGKQEFPLPDDFHAAQQLLADARFDRARAA